MMVINLQQNNATPLSSQPIKSLLLRVPARRSNDTWVCHGHSSPAMLFNEYHYRNMYVISNFNHPRFAN